MRSVSSSEVPAGSAKSITNAPSSICGRKPVASARLANTPATDEHDDHGERDEAMAHEPA